MTDKPPLSEPTDPRIAEIPEGLQRQLSLMQQRVSGILYPQDWRVLEDWIRDALSLLQQRLERYHRDIADENVKRITAEQRLEQVTAELDSSRHEEARWNRHFLASEKERQAAEATIASLTSALQEAVDENLRRIAEYEQRARLPENASLRTQTARWRSFLPSSAVSRTAERQPGPLPFRCSWCGGAGYTTVGGVKQCHVCSGHGRVAETQEGGQK